MSVRTDANPAPPRNPTSVPRPSPSSSLTFDTGGLAALARQQHVPDGGGCRPPGGCRCGRSLRRAGACCWLWRWRAHGPPMMRAWMGRVKQVSLSDRRDGWSRGCVAACLGGLAALLLLHPHSSRPRLLPRISTTSGPTRHAPFIQSIAMEMGGLCRRRAPWPR